LPASVEQRLESRQELHVLIVANLQELLRLHDRVRIEHSLQLDGADGGVIRRAARSSLRACRTGEAEHDDDEYRGDDRFRMHQLVPSALGCVISSSSSRWSSWRSSALSALTASSVLLPTRLTPAISSRMSSQFNAVP